MESLTRVTAATIAVLRVLVDSGEPCWGLQVIKSSDRPAGSVYPILERLESLGWVRSSWETDDSRSGPRRRYYELTEGGAKAAADAVRDFGMRDARQKAPRFVTPMVVNP
ncbi:MAG TPA: PadR family transcriptional regulator [Galbitalea sp.]|jgi:DNA-binding MarR family transcriptional regulator